MPWAIDCCVSRPLKARHSPYAVCGWQSRHLFPHSRSRSDGAQKGLLVNLLGDAHIPNVGAIRGTRPIFGQRHFGLSDPATGRVWRALCGLTPASVDATIKHCEIAINTVTDNIKAARGTKRVCLSCETRFYDLARAPIVCPSCGVECTATDRPTPSRITSPAGKTGWRRKPFKHPKPSLPVGDQEETLPDADDPAEEAPSTAPDDDLVLEQEPDDAHVADLVDHDVDKRKEH